MSAKSRLRFILTSLVIFSTYLTGLVPTRSALAVDGLPGSPMFGYGARLDLQGQGIRQSVDLAAGMNFTWLLVEFDWAFYWPDPTSQPKWDQLDAVSALAHENNINLVISLFNPPAWATTVHGPDPEHTATLVLKLARRYPDIVLAVELFPGANTVAGWSAQPNPQDFNILLQIVSTNLRSKAINVQMIATLSPLSPDNTVTDVPDKDFLEGLYAYGWQADNIILGIKYDKITGDALQPPSPGGFPVLRHYEDLRNILIPHHDEQRLIWVTGFSWPVELTGNPDLAMGQAGWLFQAYRLLTAQLYIGAAFFEQINPNSASGVTSSLLQPDATLHPACSLLSQLTNSTNIIVPEPFEKYLVLPYIIKGISK